MLKALVWGEAHQAPPAAPPPEADGRAFRALADPTELAGLLAEPESRLWIDLLAPSPDELRGTAEAFSLHPLAVEDAAKHNQRPKIEEYDAFYFMVVFALEAVDEDDALDLLPETAISAGRFIIHELDLFIGERYLVTVHDAHLPLLDEVAQRWRAARRTTGEGIGSLTHALLDVVVDAYFPVLDGIAARVEEMGMSLLASASPQGTPYDSRRLFLVQRDLLQLRQVVAPERDTLRVLARQEEPLFDRRVALYLRDVYDHAERVTDTIDLYQDLLNSAQQSYLSLVSNNLTQASNDLSQVMKTLTSLTLMLTVPTLIVGIYGMNFQNMPELGWSYGYPFALGLMAASAAVLFLVLKRKGWL
jgi:magnesium transporter